MIPYTKKAMRDALSIGGFRTAEVTKHAYVGERFQRLYILYVYLNGHCIKPDGYVGRDEKSALKLAVEDLCKEIP
jgi:hypothetical protein